MNFAAIDFLYFAKRQCFILRIRPESRFVPLTMSVNDIAGESGGRAAQSRNHTVCRFRRLYAPVPFREIPIPESRASGLAEGNDPRNPKRRSERIRSILRNLRILVSGSTILIISIYKRIGQKALPKPLIPEGSKEKREKREKKCGKREKSVEKRNSMVLKVKRKPARTEEKRD